MVLYWAAPTACISRSVGVSSLLMNLLHIVAICESLVGLIHRGTVPRARATGFPNGSPHSSALLALSLRERTKHSKSSKPAPQSCGLFPRCRPGILARPRRRAKTHSNSPQMHESGPRIAPRQFGAWHRSRWLSGESTVCLSTCYPHSLPRTTRCRICRSLVSEASCLLTEPVLWETRIGLSLYQKWKQ